MEAKRQDAAVGDWSKLDLVLILWSGDEVSGPSGGEALTGCRVVSVEAARFRPMDVAQFSPRDDLGYRQPPVTSAYDGLRRRGLPEVLLVHSWLPEGVTICDVRVFAAMIEEAYHTPGALHVLPDLDAHGNEQCTGIGSTGTWEWRAVSESELTDDGERHMSANAEIYQILFGPESDGKRVCTLDLVNGNGGCWLGDNHPVTFTIATRPGLGCPPSGALAADPA